MVATGKERPNRKCLRVLIADDTAAIRFSLSDLMSRLEGVEVVGLAETGAAALEMARSLKPDVMTLDIRMPEMTGINVLEVMQQEKLDVMAIVLTGLEGDEYRERCLALGASHFFHKSTEFEEVLKLLEDRARRLGAQAG
jgi:DNA-binding NarL/FixJ family response regulator